MRLQKTLVGLQTLRTAQGDESKIYAALSSMKLELEKNNLISMLERLMIHIGDISRQHNILKQMGIKSDKGGSQERETFRAIVRWWKENLTESFIDNLPYIVEFTVYENIMYYQNTTDRNKGTLKKTEVNIFDEVIDFLVDKIRSQRDIELIAKHLPKYSTGNYRTTRKVVKSKNGKPFMWRKPDSSSWFTLNGVYYNTSEKVQVKDGDVLVYQRKKQEFTIKKQAVLNKWIHSLCNKLDWTIADYIEFRKKQNTAEQLMSSKSVLGLTKDQFIKFIERIPARARLRVAQQITVKTGNIIKPVDKWESLGKWYLEWLDVQTKIAQEARDEFNEGKTPKAAKKLKIKSTGMQTIDIMNMMYDQSKSEDEINNLHQSLIEKMDLVASVFPIIDGSGSMHGFWSKKYGNLDNFDIACTLAITFSTRNPNEKFRDTLGWFSDNFKIIGESMYKNNNPNRFVKDKSLIENTRFKILSSSYTFSQNQKNLSRANPGEVARTNMGSVIESFVDLVKKGHCTTEDLPEALLFITDGENNTGMTPAQAQQLALENGWNPLFIVWCLDSIPYTIQDIVHKKLNNFLVTSGFSESVLSQVLRGIKTGSIDPETELWSIYEDQRYSMIGETQKVSL